MMADPTSTAHKRSKAPQKAAPPMQMPVRTGKRVTKKRASETRVQIRSIDLLLKNRTNLFLASPTEFISVVRAGVPAKQVETLAKAMNFSRESLYDALHIPASTIGRKLQKDQLLSSEQSERLLGIERLIGQVQTMVSESGDPENFDAGLWLGEWVNRPLPALGGAKPVEFLDTVNGQMFIARLLGQMQSGAYA
jgi:putative toxin-antitoxin system antitoxin component (TIGR02293 family)